MAPAAVVREATGYAIGGVPPLGHATALPVYLDQALLRWPVVYGAAGAPDALFPIELQHSYCYRSRGGRRERVASSEQ